MATGGHRIAGTPALLLERLAGPRQQGNSRAKPVQVHKADALLASIRQQLVWLLNTRAPLHLAALAATERTTINYGMPDLSAFPLGNGDEMARLARHIAQAIAVYEPRLHVRDVVVQASTGRQGAMLVRIEGMVSIGSVAEPFSFSLPIGGSTGDASGNP